MVTPAVMFIAAALKRDIILKGVSIPNFLKENPKIANEIIAKIKEAVKKEVESA